MPSSPPLPLAPPRPSVVIPLLVITLVAACGPLGAGDPAARATFAAAAVTCGDGKLDPGELCDDGNTRAGDGCSPTCQPEPDLRVKAFAARAVAGGVQLSGTVCLTGAAVPVATVELLLDPPSPTPACGTAGSLASATVSLAAGECASFTDTLTGVPSGRYRFALRVDGACAVAERDERNNQLAATADIAPRTAALAADAFTVTGSGAARRLTGSLCNRGAPARDVLVRLWFDRSTAPTCASGGADLAGRVTLPTGGCGTFDIAAPPAVWGSTRKGWLLLDADCAVTEANEADNARAWTVTGPPILTGWVNPFVGTAGMGNTFPGPARPFGMVQVSPDTHVNGGIVTSGYRDRDRTIVGFTHTHLSGTGIPDLRDVLFMPATGKTLPWVPGSEASPGSGYRSRFKKSSERALPGYYKVRLEDYGVDVELTATRRAALHRYTFPASAAARILVDLQHPKGEPPVLSAQLRVDGDRVVAGARITNGAASVRRVFFYARFDRPFVAYELAKDDRSLGVVIPTGAATSGSVYSANAKLKLHFKTKAGDRIQVKVGISPVSVAQAKKNLDAEIPGWDFDAVRRAAHAEWNAALSKIVVEGGTRKERRTFYSALYHVYLGPYLHMDVDGQYFGTDGKVHTASGWENYTALSLWDTFRAVHPLLTLLEPRRTTSFVRTLLARQQEGGVLPRWPLWGNFTWEMLGYPAVPVIADAYRKGVPGIDAATALTAMKRTAEANDAAIKEFRSLGYVSLDTNADEAAAITLEIAYEDWAIAQMAQALGRTADAATYRRRSAAYAKLFDKITGWMRPRHRDGRWLTPFDPTSWTMRGFSESNPQHYTFSVFHDIAGLIKLMGGAAAFDAKLDQLFSPPGVSRAAAPMGYYYHGNEPGHHIPYLYVFAGKPWKTQQLIRLIQLSDYGDDPSGLSGNDDMGQMSAWYVFSALGFYPVTPGSLTYIMGTPLFPRATVTLAAGKKLVIEAPGASTANMFVKGVTLGGKPLSRAYLEHAEVAAGGRLVFQVSRVADKTWATAPANRPR